MVIPAHGPGPFLAEAVASALAEEPAEVLVVEDGTEGVDEARALLDDLAAAGVDYDDVVETLEREGVEKFSDSFRELLDGIRAKLEVVLAR